MVHLASEGRQLGRFTLPAVAAFLGSKHLPADLHFWREGMVNWLPVAQLGLAESKPATAQQPPKRLIVLGMHRSGTSCLMGFLQASGVYLGSPSSFMATAGPQNPKGFWERREIRRICDTLLHSTGLDWDQVGELDPAKIRPAVLTGQREIFQRLRQELDHQGVWALKEPRLCFLLPLLADLIPDAVILHINRHPMSVAASLAQRNNFPLPYGIALWEAYNSAALHATQGRPVHRISYEGLVGRPQETTQWLRAILRDQHGIMLSDLSDEALQEVIDPALTRSAVSSEEGDRWLNAHQAELLAVLRSPSEAPHPPSPSRICLETLRAFERDHASAALPSQRSAPPAFGRVPQDASITLVDAAAVANAEIDQDEETVVIMPSITEARALETARLLVKQAGMRTRVFVVMDHERQGFVKTFNDTAARLTAKYMVYLAEDVYPGRDWLKIARGTIEKHRKSLLAVNDSKWRGRIASYGLVRTEWARSLYDGTVFHPGYRDHVVDEELTIMSKALGEFIYEPDSILVEIDPDKVFQGSKVYAMKSHPPDRALLRQRFEIGFGGLVPPEKLEPLRAEYFPSTNAPAQQASAVGSAHGNNAQDASKTETPKAES